MLPEKMEECPDCGERAEGWTYDFQVCALCGYGTALCLEGRPTPRGEGSREINPEQCRAARALVGWTQLELAGAAGIGLSTVADFERGARCPQQQNLIAISSVLVRAGVVFIEGGVRRKKEGSA